MEMNTINRFISTQRGFAINYTSISEEIQFNVITCCMKQLGKGEERGYGKDSNRGVGDNGEYDQGESMGQGGRGEKRMQGKEPSR